MWRINRKSLSGIKITSLLIVLIILFSFGCGKKEEKEIRIGVILPLTGDVASLGSPSLKAVNLAVEQANLQAEKEGYKFIVIAEDDQAVPAKAVSAIQKLKDVDKIRLVIGPLVSSSTMAVAPIADKNGIVIISPGSSAPGITNAGDYIFRNELSDLFGGTKQAELAYNVLKYRKVACVYINNDYGVGVSTVFKKVFLSLGGAVTLYESFDQGSTDFRNVLNKIKNNKPDAVFFISHNEILNFVRQKVEFGINTPVYTTPVFEDKNNLEKLGKAAEGIIYTYYGTFFPESNNETIKSFVNSYRKKYNEEPTYYSALAYDATNILLTALKNAKYDILKVKDELYNIRNYNGVTGVTSFDKNGDVEKPVILKAVKNGKFTVLDK